MTENKEQPLVSIIAITYNSSEYVLETLESAKAQTYRNIELIVSDDCSTDDTVEVCREWLDENKDRFVNTALITVPENTGIPANCNRGLALANGEWIKLIAGDDLLDNNCIHSFLSYILHADQKFFLVCCNKVLIKGASNLEKTVITPHPLSIDLNRQLIDYACIRPNIAPFVIIRKELLDQFNVFDESYRLLEDAPFFFKALRNNYVFHILQENLVYYRVIENSASNSSVINRILQKDLQRFIRREILPFVLRKMLIMNYLKILLETLHLKSLKGTLTDRILNKAAITERSILSKLKH